MVTKLSVSQEYPFQSFTDQISGRKIRFICTKNPVCHESENWPCVSALCNFDYNLNPVGFLFDFNERMIKQNVGKETTTIPRKHFCQKVLAILQINLYKPALCFSYSSFCHQPDHTFYHVPADLLLSWLVPGGAPPGSGLNRNQLREPHRMSESAFVQLRLMCVHLSDNMLSRMNLAVSSTTLEVNGNPKPDIHMTR